MSSSATVKKNGAAIFNNRYSKILSLLEEHDCLTVKELSVRLDVSMVTIRKDLTALESQGFLYRTHGGASKKQVYAFEKSVDRKESIYIKEKQRIALEAINHINKNDYIILASGTTIHYLARQLVTFGQLTVLTASLRVALELCNAKDVHTIQLGGEVRKSSTSVIGAFAESILSRFSCNKLFLGVDGIDMSFGISTSNLAEAYLNQEMMKMAEQVYVLADSSKIGKRGFGKIASLEQVDVFITDDKIRDKEVTTLEKVGVSVIVAS